MAEQTIDRITELRLNHIRENHLDIVIGIALGNITNGMLKDTIYLYNHEQKVRSDIDADIKNIKKGMHNYELKPLLDELGKADEKTASPLYEKVPAGVK